jgi:ATP-dependent DNA helicase RecG
VAQADRPKPALSLTTRLSEVRGIGAATVDSLAELGVRNVGQLVAYLPFKHEQLEAETTISTLEADRLVSARGTVSATRLVNIRPRPRFEAVLVDDSGRLDLVWFNGLYLRSTIHPGDRLMVQGKAKRRAHLLQMVNPNWELLKAEAEPALRDERLRPVYPASERLPSRRIELAIGKVLDAALPLIEDHLPEELRAARAMPTLAQAYEWMHRPPSAEQAKAARRRLAYDELLLLQLALAVRRQERREQTKAPVLRWSEAIDRRIRARLPFTLTPAQDKVLKDVVADVTSTVPMNRLIQGDVGSGKTVVALYAMLLAVASGHQAALMAPTELLAQQHWTTMQRLLAGSKVRLGLLTGAMRGAERAATVKALAEGRIDLVIGTHALITDAVVFKSLAIAVIDEQHRFGVLQRGRLRAKGAADVGQAPHIMVMTATPIPRTLAMTLMGDLDVSTIKGLPPGRQPIKTRVVAPQLAGEVYAWVRKRLEAGERAYIIAPAIDPGDEPGALASVTELHERLSQSVLAGRKLGVMHGQLPVAERSALMERFRRGDVEALVSTTVVEVGVDVPSATVMVIEHAERFGLAQLHQLRGRVGRGEGKSYCILIAAPTTPEAEQRLQAIATAGDGFALAESDLSIRGFGEMTGSRQAGLPPFKVADLPKDLELLTLAQRDAQKWVERSPGLRGVDEQRVRRRMLKTNSILGQPVAE